jgi:PHS family inorganic phosphate transporter-like MFS transporter
MHDTKGTWLSLIITGMANFSTQYNFQCIGVALVMMSASECTSDDDNCRNGKQAEWVQSMASAAVFLGAICGQLTMGYLGDLFSRNFALCWTLVLAGFSSIICSVASVGSPQSVYSVIITFRFLLGVGLGGVFPLAATKASEDYSSEDSEHHNHTNSLASSWSFFWQIPGLWFPWFLAYCLESSSILTTGNRWRLVLGLGAIPSFVAALLLIFEAYLDGASLFQAKKSENSNQLPLKHIVELAMQPENRRKLLASGGGWFFFDVVVYGIGLIAGDIIEKISEDDDNVSSQESVQNISSKQMITTAVTIVVTVFSICLIPHLGLRGLQMTGFLIVTFFCALLACFFEYLNHYNPDGLFALYILAYSSLNFGLGATSYSIPAAIYPKEIRSTFNGISAAMGKLGAFIGAFSFIYIIQSPAGYSGLLGICAFVGLSGAWVTYVNLKPSDFHDIESSKLEQNMNQDLMKAHQARERESERSINDNM